MFDRPLQEQLGVLAEDAREGEILRYGDRRIVS